MLCFGAGFSAGLCCFFQQGTEYTVIEISHDI